MFDWFTNIPSLDRVLIVFKIVQKLFSLIEKKALLPICSRFLGQRHSLIAILVWIGKSSQQRSFTFIYYWLLGTENHWTKVK